MVNQRIFRLAALTIIITHVLATACAVVALKLHADSALLSLLGTEIVLLVLGFTTHHYLHRSDAGRTWAMARLVAEIARSVAALDCVPGNLGYLFRLPFPGALGPLLRTLNVLHLRETHRLTEDWAKRRAIYVATRLTDFRSGQIAYYETKLERAQFWHRVAQGTFLIGSGSAILITTAKLVLTLYSVLPAGLHDIWTAVLGALAIVLPVLAVAALSLAASFDLVARVNTYREVGDFLEVQLRHLNNAGSERDFANMALETEARLLGETASWYSRRVFTSVT